MKNWKVFLLSVAMATSFVTDVHCAKSTNKETKAKSGSNKVKIGWNNIKNKFSNKDAMDSKDAKVLKNAVSIMSELGHVIGGMTEFAKIVEDMPKKAGVADGLVERKIKVATKIVTENINSRGTKLRSASGTSRSIIKELYESIGKAVEKVAGLEKAYKKVKDGEDVVKKKTMRNKLIAIHKGLKQIYEAMKNQIEPNAKSVEDNEDEQEETETDDE